MRYGPDQYADVLVEEKVHHVAYQTCQVQEPTSMDEALKQYISKLIEKYGLSEAKPVSTPLVVLPSDDDCIEALTPGHFLVAIQY